MIKVTDVADVRKKIAAVEGFDWMAQDAWSGENAENDCVARAFRIYEARKPLSDDQDPDRTTVYGARIYGAGGYHRYFLTYSGEVVFSERHACGDTRKAEAAGFRIWR